MRRTGGAQSARDLRVAGQERFAEGGEGALVGGVDAGAGLEQRVDGMCMAGTCCQVQRGVVAAVECVEPCAAGDEDVDGWDVATGGGDVQWGAATWMSMSMFMCVVCANVPLSSISSSQPLDQRRVRVSARPWAAATCMAETPALSTAVTSAPISMRVAT